jgi:hypothetical protein
MAERRNESRVSGRNETKTYGKSATGRKCEAQPTLLRTDIFGKVLNKR